jgi:hypothetical protein
MPSLESCWIPPSPVTDPDSKTTTSIQITAPGDVPSGYTLTLQYRRDEDFSYTNSTSGVTSSQLVTLGGLSPCTQYIVRWIAVPTIT